MKQKNKDILVVSNISRFFYQGKTKIQALKNINLSLYDSDIAALVGPSGSGKSTLLNIIGTLDSPDNGNVYINGNEINYKDENCKINLRKSTIGFIFQSFNLIPTLSAMENVELALYTSNVNELDRKKETIKILDLVGLKDRIHHYPSQLSGGQQQRVAIARALVHKPKLVLADEPTANLDRKTASSIVGIVSELREELGVSFLISTHDDRIIKNIDNVIKLSDGYLKQ